MTEYFDLDYVAEQMGEPITGIVHIGAHYAEEAAEYHERGIPAIWFEAHPSYAQKMFENLAQFPNQLGFEALLSDVTGETVDFWTTADEYASSMLKPAYHQIQNPHAYVNGKIRLGTIRYDEAMNTIREQHRVTRKFDYNVLLLDVQGAELKVWNGMGEYRSGFKAIISEYSTVEFYEGVPQLEDLDRAYEGFVRVYPDKPIIHGDALYVRQDSAR